MPIKLLTRPSLTSYFAALCCISSLLFQAQPVFAWGERGHDIITRVAVQNMRLAVADNKALMQPFIARDHMLGHLSNTPDIVWRAPYMTELERSENYSTHFINLEKVYLDVNVWNDLPIDYSVYTTNSRAKGFEPEEVGTAPWRVLQLYTLMVDAFKKVALAKDPKAFESSVNEALLVAGIMSHFVGDLANPHHTSANYDGQLTGQRGLHAYFESDVVGELSFELSAKVYVKAQADWLDIYTKPERKEIVSSAQKIVWALLANSHNRLPQLLELDRTHSLIKESNKIARAKRKPVNQTADSFQEFATERLSVGASALSALWLLAWQEAGSPDMSEFRSYYYPVKPDFIRPDYINR